MRVTTLTCDLCKKECHEKRFGIVSGCIMKMNEKGELGDMIFEGHYCDEHITKITQYIEKLSKENESKQ